MSKCETDLAGAGWRKTSYSNGNGGCCVEVAGLEGGSRAVRDSKDPAGPVLTFTAQGWIAFTAGVRSGEFG
ncbi:MAG: DUF397 domain-containing protein [Pseudonocardiaceae bacterium]